MSDENTSHPLQYRLDGPQDAPVLVLGPCLGTTWHMWDRQIPELTRHWRVLRYDLPGHGGAPAHAADSVAALADRLIAALDELGVDRFGYAGCSLGGAVGLRLALSRPQRLASLALVSSAPRFGTPDAWRQTGVVVRANGLEQIARSAPDRWFTPAFRAAQAAIVDWAVQMVRTIDPGCYIAACEALAGHDVRDELGRIAVPTLVLGGAEDPDTPPADARVLVAGIPDARLAIVPGASHLVPVEQPGAVTDLLVRHFEGAWAGVSAPSAAAAQPLRAPRGPVAATAATPAGPHDAAAAADATAVLTTPGFAPLAASPAGEAPVAVPADQPDPYEAGMKIRREMLGDAHVDRAVEEAGDFSGDFDDLLTRYAWGGVWARPGLDRRTRSVITLTALASGGHHDALASHTRAALRNGLTPPEIKEVLLHTAVYCGFPAAGAAFTVAQRVIREEIGAPGHMGE